jgi:dihydroxyacid dehydratase/phosphogluconate dehydratase
VIAVIDQLIDSTFAVSTTPHMFTHHFTVVCNVLVQFLMEAGLIDGSCMTVTGKTIAENLKDLPGLSDGQEIIKPLSDPIKETGHIQV